MTIFLVALLVSSSELELLAIPQTSQEAGATKENKPLFSVEAYSLARPLPQGSLGPCAENRMVTGVSALWCLGASAIYQASLEWEGTNLHLEETSPPCELPKGRRPSPSRGQTK